MIGCKYFTKEEVFHPSLVNEKSWSTRPQAIWDALDALREAWGRPITINSATLHNCGVRPVGSRVGATKSHHQPIYPSNQAFDLHGRTAEETEELYHWVLREGWEIGHVGRVEDRRFAPSWVHLQIEVEKPTSCVVFAP